MDEFDAKISKWQEQRIARKLRGEYESAVLHLSQVVDCSRYSLAVVAPLTAIADPGKSFGPFSCLVCQG